ncbi:TRAP transporter substrate-binding protein [Marinospirillum sp.]|uniref:TRAP transporter substrate-binding protein n=1 Tax=Marinospirillum sp. TaxID=2183934 RepID=UPI0028709A54|nr:TRAP transporter substrate-binding protein [Marinospirillum sp.]MDR9468074.1 TRAP transporter substrate-binding protein [Marinospirillum sp.]
MKNKELNPGRRKFIQNAALGAGAAATASVAAPAIAQNRKTWRMVTTWPRNFPGLGVGAQRLADRITAMSGGELTIKVYSAGELVPPLQSFDAVIEGSAEMSHGAAYYWQNKSPATSFFTGVPYGMTSRELSAWVRYMGGQEIWDKVYDQFGVKGFLSGDTGTQAGGWFRSEIKSLDDVQGINFRTPGLGGEVWSRMGANVVNMAAGEIYQALQSGALDAAEFVGPYNDLALGFHQICKEYYLPSFNEPGLATELVVNKSKFSELPKHLQEIVEIACQAEYDQVASDFYANDPVALKKLVEEHGVNLRTFPEDLLEAGANAAMDIINELREHDDPLTRETAQSYVKNFNLLRTRTELVDQKFGLAREKYIKYS